MTDRVFDLEGPLPTGTTVIEASAGTGKTYTVSGLAARYVAEGVARIDQLLVVTFGVLATAEVRERTRSRLREVHDGLADPGWAMTAPDPVLRVLARGDAAEVARRRERLRRALAAFDEGAVETTHGFSNRMLGALGFAADTEPDTAVVANVADLVREVTVDFYLRRYVRDTDEPPFPLATAVDFVTEAVGVPDAGLVPVPAPEDQHPVAQRVRLAGRARAEVAARKRERRLRGYDDMLTGLRDALDDVRRPVTASQARALLRDRYRVVLVDEFQDTDPVQWDALRDAFHGHATVVLVGDPKQSIYRFRGADVLTYLRAREAAGARLTLATNHRSDGPLVAALEVLMGGLSLGHPAITVGPVAARHTTSRLLDPGGGALPPVRIRHVVRDEDAFLGGTFPVSDARARIARDVAGQVAALLSSGAQVAVHGEPRPVRAEDVAVLVKRNEDGRDMHAALTAAGVPVTLSGAESVFAGAAAAEWVTLLRALEQPHRVSLARLVALTCFVGWSGTRLARAVDGPDTHELDLLSDRVRSWSAVLSTRGVAALLETVTSETDLPARVLARPGGERLLTDLRHVGQLLHGAATRERLGVSALLAWLRQRVDERGTELGDERSIRLESDAASVQILTVHRSKGLEWPVVFAPSLWDRNVNDKPRVLRLHSEQGRLLDVGGPNGPGWLHRLGEHQAGEAGEDLRLTYVALTRAACQVVLWWAPTARNTAGSGLHRLLFGEPDGDGALPGAVAVPESDDEVVRRLSRLGQVTGGAVVVEAAGSVPPAGAAARPPVPVPGRARRFTRTLDADWSRTSYSRLTAAAHEAAYAGAEAESAFRDDEPLGTSEPVVPPGLGAGPGVAGPAGERAGVPARAQATPSPMSSLPAGAALGSEIHEILETVDTSAPDLAAELTRAAVAASRGATGGASPAAVAEALLPAMTTPLGAMTRGLDLASFAPADRLPELDFELPLAGGDDPRGDGATLVAVAGLMARHLDPADPLAGYPRALLDMASEGPVRGFRGYLTGSIDALLRVRGQAGGHDTYVVVDYKTNRLGRPGEPLTAWHYRPEALVAEMVSAHYPLQAILYSVATHRFLRWRVPGYDPAVHLGGALYLFLRGMCGPATPVLGDAPTGVMAWRPPPALVVALSDLLDGRSSDDVTPGSAGDGRGVT